MNIYELSAVKIAELIKSRQISAIEVMQTFIDRIQKVNPSINAIHQFYPEKLLKEAEQVDLAVKNGKTLGRLHGVPISLKDGFGVKGFNITRGFKGLEGNISEKDATVVSRLKKESCIILGITNVPEMLSAYEADNLIYGRTNNPYDLNRTPGGSSGGESALIAAGGSVFGIGSDAGGSTRLPAHYAGISGHQPTNGRVSLSGVLPTDGDAGLFTEISSLGPLARHVEDLTLIMEIISGPDQMDPHLAPVPFQDPHQVNLKDLKVGYFYKNPKSEPTLETINAVKKTINILEPLVHSVKTFDADILNDEYRLHWSTFMIGGDGGASIKEFHAKFPNVQISPLYQQVLKMAEQNSFSTLEFKKRFIEIEKYRYAMFQHARDFDVIISPVASTPAREHGTTNDHPYDFSYVRIYNLLGWPATVVPVAHSDNGLPIGVQIAAKPWDDHLCLSVAEALQKQIGVFPVVS